MSPTAGAGGVARRPPPRWGLGDALWVWFGGLLLTAVVGSIVVAARGRTGLAADAVDLVAALLVQDGFIVAALAVLARLKGVGSLAADFGLALHWRDAPWLAVGILLQVAAIGLISLVSDVGNGVPQQEAARTLERGHGPEVALLVAGVVLLAPLAEELLFRGLLLRSLLRRTSAPIAVVVSAAVFAAAHLLDPSTAPLLVPLAGLGIVSGIRAVRTGELSQSLLLHAGFNLLSALTLLGK